MSFSEFAAAAALLNISGLRNKIKTELKNYSGGSELTSSNDEIDAANSVFNAFYNSGSPYGNLEVINFFPNKIYQIFNHCSNYLQCN